MTSRSVLSRSDRVGTDPSGGSPGHHTVTGRSWMSSGATSAERWRPVSPPAVRKISSEQVSGASARGSTQWAWTLASSHGGPRPHLGLARDDDLVHHRRARGDVPAAGLAAVALEHQVGLRPDPGEL